jgi:hypothetical protein
MTKSRIVRKQACYFSIAEEGCLGENIRKNGFVGMFISRLVHTLPVACDKLVEEYKGQFLEVPELPEPQNEQDDSNHCSWFFHFHYMEHVFLASVHRSMWHYLVEVSARIEDEKAILADKIQAKIQHKISKMGGTL